MPQSMAISAVIMLASVMRGELRNSISMPGRSSPKRSSRGIIHREPKIGPTASDTDLRRARICVSTSSRISSSDRDKTRDRDRPASVSTTARVLRIKSLQPNSCSRRRIWLLTVVALTQSSSAACLKLRCRAALSKVRSAARGRFRGCIRGARCAWINFALSIFAHQVTCPPFRTWQYRPG